MSCLYNTSGKKIKNDEVLVHHDGTSMNIILKDEMIHVDLQKYC